MPFKLTEDNFLAFAMRHYDNPQCHSLQEFDDDLKRFLYLKKLFSRYINTGELKERLIINHLVVLHNLFDKAATPMLFYKIDKEYWSCLITFLIFLSRMPEDIPGTQYKMTDFPLDEHIVNVLRNL